MCRKRPRLQNELTKLQTSSIFINTRLVEAGSFASSNDENARCRPNSPFVRRKGKGGGGGGVRTGDVAAKNQCNS